MRPTYDLVCLSHLRWDFVYQRPQHLLSRFARDRRVFFVEEPHYREIDYPVLHVDRREPDGVIVAAPHLRVGTSPQGAAAIQRALLDHLFEAENVTDFVFWFYTPMAMPFTRHLRPAAIVYDCMDELSAFKGAPPGLRTLEIELLRRANVVFTGGHSLYAAKRQQHSNIHPMPSSVDRAHFAQARAALAEPADQATIPHPRAGFFGVIDERMDLELLAGVADLRPELHIVMVGPVVKIDPATLPQRPNLHWLGGRSYAELPSYIAGWDVALLPFARNESTRFISPTKTPEYLAAGRPVVSTSIQDVLHPYGESGLAHIADTPGAFAAAIDAALAEDAGARRRRADELLATMSWNGTFSRMRRLVDASLPATRPHRVAPTLARAVAK